MNHTERERAIQRARSNAWWKGVAPLPPDGAHGVAATPSDQIEDADVERERAMRRILDMPINFTVSESQFIELYEGAENLAKFWNPSMRIKADMLIRRFGGRR